MYCYRYTLKCFQFTISLSAIRHYIANSIVELTPLPLTSTMKVQSTRLVVVQLLLLLLPTIVSALAAPSVSDKAPKKFFGGAGVGRLNLDSKAGKENAWLSHYDMVLCERIQGRPKTKSGLFVPEADLPKLHICKGKHGRGRRKISVYIIFHVLRFLFAHSH